MRDETDACWGGRNPTFKNDAQKAWMERDGRARLDRARLAEGIWRRRPLAGRDQDPQAGNGADRRAQSADELRHLDARPGPAQIWQRGAEEALSCPRSRAARSAGARAIPSPAPAPTSPRCRPSARTRATIGWSTARRSGPAMPTRPTGSSAWSAPIRRRPSTRGSASSCSTWRRPGVSTKPILLISGNSPFCETFFDDVKVPKDQLVGELNKGWDVAKYLLGHEREMISGMGLGGQTERARRGARPTAARPTIRCCAPTSPASTSTRWRSGRCRERFIDELKAGRRIRPSPR